MIHTELQLLLSLPQKATKSFDKLEGIGKEGKFQN